MYLDIKDFQFQDIVRKIAADTRKEVSLILMLKIF